MNYSCLNRIIGFSILLWMNSLTAQTIHHEIKAELQPDRHLIKITDRITLPAAPGKQVNNEIHFLLHGDLKIDPQSTNLSVRQIHGKIDSTVFGVINMISIPTEIPIHHYSFRKPAFSESDLKLTLTYEGPIYHPIEQKSEEYARSFSETPGIIDTAGSVLSGSSFWLPWFNEELVKFNLEVIVPEKWDVVSQGKRTRHEITGNRRTVRWESPELMDEVYLVAAPFTEYSRQVGTVTAQAFLRTPDESLANKYLETTAQYLEMFTQLIGPYPYAKFALVENFWETGYGMPSFTLLGSKIIRFPFILHSSYPHEILHNWWGNSVFVDYDQGNWCEGLTVYLADHLIKEQRGEAAAYRRDALQTYTDYVKASKDFPLMQFKARHDAATSAVGYNKSMMIYHQLRLHFGDEIFKKALQQFYQQNKFKKATFQDLQTAFEQFSKEKLDWFFEQWIERAGAPRLELSLVKAQKTSSGFELNFRISQIQEATPYRLRVPVAITLTNSNLVQTQTVELNQQQQDFSVKCTEAPLRIDVDPEFDVFRRLDRNEIPPALSQVFGVEKVTIVLPYPEKDHLYPAYRRLAEIWGKSNQVHIVDEIQLEELPDDGATWLLGRTNTFADKIKNELQTRQVVIEPDSIRIEKQKFSFTDRSFIFTIRHPDDPDLTVAWLFTENPEAIECLSRKLPHYGKYSYLGFAGSEPTNDLKGQWPVINSPLSFQIEPNQEAGKLPERKALAELKPVFSEPDLVKHIQFLASDQLNGRGLGTPELDQAAEYIAVQFKMAGLEPGSDDQTWFQTWTEPGGPENQPTSLKNVIGIIPGKKAGWAEQSVVICAHYDHLGLGWPDVRPGSEGQIHNGADDNASGVSVLIELAKNLKNSYSPLRTLVFVAFTGEEAGRLGSIYYVNHSRRFPADKIWGVLNLDSVGRLGNQPILILGGNSASEWVHIFRGIGFVTGIQSKMVAEDLDASDQKSFLEKGIPAVQLFSGPHLDYHRPTDDFEKIDFAGLMKIAAFTKEAVVYLAERENVLTSPLQPTTGTHPTSGISSDSGRRTASLGTMPDFEFQGEGVRIQAVSPGSPAEKALLQKGDILKALNGESIKSLREFSAILKKHQPGEEVEVAFERDGKVQQVKVVLAER